MYRVALVQNQSEMAHYGYADARQMVGDRGYRVELYTGDNISTLSRRMRDDDLDCVALASNALNDRTIMDELCTPEWAAELGRFLERDRGLLSFHQLGLAMRKGPTMRLLPDPLAAIRPVVRPATEPLVAGDPRLPRDAPHVALLYPNPVDAELVAERCMSLHNPRGLYWHYWDDVDLTDWDVLLSDALPQAGPRPLVVSTKESSRGRVVLSALPLDWQKQHELAANLFIYAVEGRHNTAVLAHRSREPVGFSYLLAGMRDRRLGFRVYDMEAEQDALIDHLTNGIHTSLVIEPAVDHRLPVPLERAVASSVGAGELRVFTFAEPRYGHSIRPLSVVSPELSPLRLLRSVEFQIHADMEGGYVDDSLWGHVETLQTLNELPECTGDFTKAMAESWVIVANHDRAGSYDEVFGASVALWWMRARCLGLDDSRTAETQRWLRRTILVCPDRDRAMAYVTFAGLRPLEREETEDLRGIVNRLKMGDADKPSEADLVVYLRAAVLADLMEIVPRIVDVLADCQDADSRWVDPITTATIVSALLDVHPLLRGLEGAGSTVARIEEVCLRAVVYILDELGRASGHAYPWGGKASVSVRCLQAWIKFDSLVDIPVHTVVDVLTDHHREGGAMASSRTALAVLEQMKQENQRLRQKLRVATDDAVAARRLGSRGKVAMLGTALALYLLVGVGGGMVANGGWSGLGQALGTGFGEAWGIHLSVLGLAAALLAVPWRQWFSRDNSRP
ncbi:hypothetical protein Psi02_38070 [Planotetraspora silvatica]|uniref:Uncharacterized protein n=1 Tax=Planotetraspora silvatica TaxID=234614 RepID=A0A8J3UKA6_9ACTN|nr:hypothetical protein [Planotetraspora silvatica]GII47383.1 hypothetical protein Psi02_38070 [Planotetraspora silvatica]